MRIAFVHMGFHSELILQLFLHNNLIVFKLHILTKWYFKVSIVPFWEEETHIRICLWLSTIIDILFLAVYILVNKWSHTLAFRNLA